MHTATQVMPDTRLEPVNIFITMFIDRASFAEKTARKDEKTLCWPPPVIARLVTKISGKQNSAEITKNQTTDDIYIGKLYSQATTG